MEERLQKWIARCGISSRRAAEELLRQGRVTLNGRVAGLGESGDPERDTLLVIRPGYVTAAAKGPCREELELVRCGLAQLAAQYPQCVEVEGNCR